MKNTIIKYSLVFFVFITNATSCTKGGPDESQEPPKKPVGKAIAILPANAETCADFIAVQSDESKATILFSWTPATNASNYLVEVFESNVMVRNAIIATTSTEFTLAKGKSYTWIITAKNGDEAVKSDTYSFTTPGEAVGNFAPYAADILIVLNAGTNELMISWVGKDEDGDTLTYDVIVKEGSTTIADYEDLTIAALNPIISSAEMTYIVQVTSKDGFGISLFPPKL